MPRKFFKKYTPHPERIRRIKGLGMVTHLLANPSLWHLHRHSVARAFANGLFWMAIPIPSQMLAAVVVSIFTRANLPLSIVLVWVSNPFTMAPIFYFNYRIGSLLVSHPPRDELKFELSWHWITTTLGDLWLPLYLGSLIVGGFLAVTSYVSIHLFWRWHVTRSWEKRIQLRRQAGTRKD
ncbi:MAG: DUF2062 domain-containing protein [Hydrogenovibrio sp.]|uniref:DUF2062 domain-containing protein n=1 Tax=Hydrogenovibrio sp. TaxID=2065821 RepID=UPI00286FB9F3|nr:DUF2062 domain-containing protein [Hydrogenovibrio sp.]MDR9497967.1 DUF2062 domain-containing protein [Hydrogenovibrio sp.]